MLASIAVIAKDNSKFVVVGCIKKVWCFSPTIGGLKKEKSPIGFWGRISDH